MFRTLSSRHAMHWLVSSAFTACFYYWDNLTYYVEDDDTISWPVLMLFVCILLSFLWVGYVLFYSFKNQAGFSVLTPFFLLIVYLSRVYYGGEIASFDGCDMSLCSQLRLYRNGCFRLSTSYVNEHKFMTGSYDIVCDSVVLNVDRTFSLNYFKYSWADLYGKILVSHIPDCRECLPVYEIK